MANTTIPINAGWKPDLSDADQLKVGGLKIAKNIIPARGYYYPLCDPAIYKYDTPIGLDSTDTVGGGYVVQDSDGSLFNFVGTTNKIYRFNQDSITSVGKVAGYTDSSVWNFCEYGNWLLAINVANPPQVLKTISSGTFEDLAGTPPKAKYILVNNTHLILASTMVGGSFSPKSIMWSARGDPEDWTFSLLTGAGDKTFYDMVGIITGIASIGDKFVVFGTHSITLGYYVGGLYTFNFQTNYIKNVGCFFPQSIISIHDKVLFWGKESIYMFDGTTLTNIGKDISQTLFADVNITYMHKINVVHDKNNNLIIWAYPSTASSGKLDRFLIYNYIEDRFTTANIDTAIDCVFMASGGGIPLDTLTTTKIDDLNVLIDSISWFDNDIRVFLASITDSGGSGQLNIYTLSGGIKEAEIETGEFANVPNVQRALKVYSPFEHSGIGSDYGTVQVKHRANHIRQWTTGLTKNFKEDGSADVRVSNQKLRLNLKCDTHIDLGNEIIVEGIILKGE